METVVVNFSGRSSDGNCAKISCYIKEILNDGAPVRIIKVSDLSIHACDKCGYECFPDQTACPYYNDDAVRLYDTLLSAGQIIYLVPSYSSCPCSNYFIVQERSQCYFDDEKYTKFLDIKKKFIVIANSGFDNIKNIIKSYYQNMGSDDILQLSSRKYNNSSISGTLIGAEEVKALIRRFINGGITVD